MIFGEKNVGNSHHASVVSVVSNSTYPAIQILSYFTATATLLWYLSFRFNLGLEFYVGDCKSSTYFRSKMKFPFVTLSQSYEIKLHPRAILGFKILEIFSVEN